MKGLPGGVWMKREKEREIFREHGVPEERSVPSPGVMTRRIVLIN